MTEEEKIALDAKIEALTLAVNSIFTGAQGGQRMREAFTGALQQKAVEAGEGSPREGALLVELSRWKDRRP